MKSEFDRVLEETEREVYIFLEKIKKYKNCGAFYKNNGDWTFFYSKDRASVKRSSMDISNKLVELRKASVYR